MVVANSLLVFSLGSSAICSIINETSKAIWDCQSEQYLRPPRTIDDWKHIVKDFKNIWNLPHCIGVIDGKPISIKSPLNSESLYYNCKVFFSMNLKVICDARYIFSMVYIGCFGSNNNSGVFHNSPMGKAFFIDEISLLVAECLEDSPTFGKVPYVLVDDEAFSLQPWLLRPYPGQGTPAEKRIFNHRLSRACRVIENASGILDAHWRVFMQPIQSIVEKTDRIVKATICLHNFLQQTNSAGYCPTGFVVSYDETGRIKEGEWRH